MFGALTATRTPHFASTHSLLEATAERFPGGFAAHFYLGRSWLERGQPERAVGPLRRAHAIMPGIEACTLALAKALARTGRTDEARDVLEKALARSPSPALRRRLRALAR